MGKHWPEPNEMGLEWTARFPRPKDDGTHHPVLLEDRQRQWDQAEARRKELAATAQKIRDDREAKKQVRRDAAVAEEEARRQRKSTELEETLRKRYLATGATQAQWEAERESVISEHRRRLVAEGDAEEVRARAAQSILYQSF